MESNLYMYLLVLNLAPPVLELLYLHVSRREDMVAFDAATSRESENRNGMYLILVMCREGCVYPAEIGTLGIADKPTLIHTLHRMSKVITSSSKGGPVPTDASTCFLSGSFDKNLP